VYLPHELEKKVNLLLSVLLSRFKQLAYDQLEQKINCTVLLLQLNLGTVEDFERVDVENKAENGNRWVQQIEKSVFSIVRTAEKVLLDDCIAVG